MRCTTSRLCSMSHADCWAGLAQPEWETWRRHKKGQPVLYQAPEGLSRGRCHYLGLQSHWRRTRTCAAVLAAIRYAETPASKGIVLFNRY